jgi:hypothetical protein
MPTDLNLRAAILITRELPGTGTIKVPLTIWWRGSSFHIHAESGLPVDDLLALANSPSGFGRQPRTKEEFMDTRIELPGATEIHGDRAAPHGTVVENGRVLELDTEQLLPLAELVLSSGASDPGSEPSARGRFLDRDVVEYTTHRTDDDGARSTIRRLVAGPYTLLREVTDEHRGALLRVEVLTLTEGRSAVADAPNAP